MALSANEIAHMEESLDNISGSTKTTQKDTNKVEQKPIKRLGEKSAEQKALDIRDLGDQQTGIQKSLDVRGLYSSSTNFNKEENTATLRRSFLGGEGRQAVYKQQIVDGKKTDSYSLTEKSVSSIIGSRQVQYASEDKPKSVAYSSKKGTFAASYETDADGKKHYNSIRVGDIYNKNVWNGSREGSLTTQKEYLGGLIINRSEMVNGKKEKTGKAIGAYSNFTGIRSDGSSLNEKRFENIYGTFYSKVTEKDANGIERVTSKKKGFSEYNVQKIEDGQVVKGKDGKDVQTDIGKKELHTKTFTAAYKRTTSTEILGNADNPNGPKTMLEVTKKRYLGFITKTSRNLTELPLEKDRSQGKDWSTSKELDAKSRPHDSISGVKANPEPGKKFAVDDLFHNQREFKSPAERRPRPPELEKAIEDAKNRIAEKDWKSSSVTGKLQTIAKAGAAYLGDKADSLHQSSIPGAASSANAPKAPPMPDFRPKSGFDNSNTVQQSQIPKPGSSRSRTTGEWLQATKGVAASTMASTMNYFAGSDKAKSVASNDSFRTANNEILEEPPKPVKAASMTGSTITESSSSISSRTSALEQHLQEQQSRTSQSVRSQGSHLEEMQKNQSDISRSGRSEAMLTR